MLKINYNAKARNAKPVKITRYADYSMVQFDAGNTSIELLELYHKLGYNFIIRNGLIYGPKILIEKSIISDMFTNC